MSGGKRGSLRTTGNFTHDAFGGGFGVGIGREGSHLPFAGGGICNAIVTEFSGRAVDFRLACSVSNGDWELHAPVCWSSRIVCKLCANINTTIVFL